MKIALCVVLAFCAMAFAEGCQTRRTSYDSKTRVWQVDCNAVYRAFRDLEFIESYGGFYARYYGKRFRKEGNLIVETDGGKSTFWKFFYAQGKYWYYGSIEYLGANVVNCFSAPISGCDHVEYTDFARYLGDFLASSARRNR